MSDPGIGEKRDEIGRGSDQVRMFVADTLIRVGHDATVRERPGAWQPRVWVPWW